MTLHFPIWHTKKINIQNYYKVMRRAIILTAGYQIWKDFKAKTTMHVYPLSEMDKYRHMFAHLNIETSEGIAWGFTGKNEVYVFLNDVRNSFIFRSNIMPFIHEILHVIYQQQFGTFHVSYRTDNPPEVRRLPQKGSLATAIVHDNYYGTKETLRIWISWGIGWLPVKFPWIPFNKAKELYPI